MHVFILKVFGIGSGFSKRANFEVLKLRMIPLSTIENLIRRGIEGCI